MRFGGTQDDGVVGEEHEDQDDVVEPARPPLSAARAREMMVGCARRWTTSGAPWRCSPPGPRRARRPGVAPLGHSSWESYCDAEFGISRAQAYRLLDVARALAAIHDTVAAGPDPSRMRDSDPAAAAALDYGLSQRALIAVSSRSGNVAEL
ncbi:hypothetical protein NKH18_01780 [Streptomyces sp. M10(2022)]